MIFGRKINPPKIIEKKQEINTPPANISLTHLIFSETFGSKKSKIFSQIVFKASKTRIKPIRKIKINHSK